MTPFTKVGAWAILMSLLGTPALLVADSTLNFPRLSFDPNTLTGIAIVNPASQDASVTLTAYGADGNPLTGAGIVNPATVTIPASRQFASLTSQLFGSGLDPATVAWFQATSPVDGLTGLFLILSASLSSIDGADLPVTSQKLIFQRLNLASGASTELNIVNPGTVPANVMIQLKGTPFPPPPGQITIPARGVVRLDAAAYFNVSSVDAGAYVAVDSDVEVAGFEWISAGTTDAVGLNARRGAEKLSNLYLPQLSVLGPNRTQLGVTNYSGDPVILTITAYKPDGTLFDSANLKNNPVTRSLRGEGSLCEDVQSMFGFYGDNPLSGWIAVKATSESINGYASYSNQATGGFAAVTTAAQGQTRAIFPQLATASPFSTGVAILNPGSLAANVRILAIQSTGEVLGSLDTVLQPGHLISKQIGGPDFIPGASGVSGGAIWVKSDVPVYVASLIASDKTLTSVPPQSVPDGYNPDSALPTVKLNPPIAIVPPGSSQQFALQGASESLSWLVNGSPGGSSASGTIDSTGKFKAPGAIPSPQVVTITAQGSQQSAGASADVLDKSAFISNLKVVQSVAYLGSLQKIYAAELTALSAPSGTAQAAAALTSQVLDVSSGAQAPIVTYTNENIVKMISFTASNGTEYLLLLGQVGGRIIRLNPATKATKDVVTGLNAPTAMVFDPASGDLLVAEKDKISIVARATLESDSGPNAGSAAGKTADGLPAADGVGHMQRALVISGASGIAVDRCSEKIYYSVAAEGKVMEYDPTTLSYRTVASGLLDPGQLLGIYRTGITCPASFHLLVVERGADRVDLVIPSSGEVTAWVNAPGVVDLAFVPQGNPYLPLEGIILGDYSVQAGGSTYLVQLSNLYDLNPPNPPNSALVDNKADLSVTQTIFPNPGSPGFSSSFSVTVTNNGPAVATGVFLVDTLPAGVAFVSGTAPDQGSCGQAGRVVTCYLGTLQVGARVRIAVQVVPDYSDTARSITNAATVSGVEVDPYLSNNVSTFEMSVLAPVASQLTVTGVAPSAKAGTTMSVTVSVRDQLGKVLTGYRGGVVFSSVDGLATIDGTSTLLSPSYQFTADDAGVHTFAVGFPDISCGSAPPTSTGLTVTDTANRLSVTTKTSVYGSVSSFQMTATPDPVVLRSPMTVNVRAIDSCYNTVLDYLGTVAFYISGYDPEAVLPGNYTFTATDAGVHEFSATITVPPQPESPALIMSDVSDSYVQGYLYVNVQANPAVRLSVTLTPAYPYTPPIFSFTPLDVTVAALDAYDNVVPGYSGTVTFSSTDIYATLPAPYVFIPTSDLGIHTFFSGIEFRNPTSFPPIDQTVTVTDTVSGITGSVTVTVQPGG